MWHCELVRCGCGRYLCYEHWSWVKPGERWDVCKDCSDGEEEAPLGEPGAKRARWSEDMRAGDWQGITDKATTARGLSVSSGG